MTQTAGITVQEALSLSALAGARLVAGLLGADRVIRSVNMMEVPDIARFVRAGELLVTTAYPIHRDEDALSGLVPMLSQNGLAGLAVKPGRYLENLPRRVLSVADHLRFPIIELPESASFNDILADVLGTILNRQALQLERSRKVHERLSAVAMEGGSLNDLVRTLSRLVGHPAAITDPNGRVLAAAGASGPPPEDLHHVETRTIRSGRHDHGQVSIWSQEPLPDDSVIAMEQAATVAALQLAQERAVMSRQRRFGTSFLEELLSGHVADRDAVLQVASAVGWDLTIPRFVMLVSIVVLPRRGPLPVAGGRLENELLESVAKTLGPSAVAWGLRTQLGVLVSADRWDPAAPSQLARAVQADLGALESGLEVSVAFGTCYSDLTDFYLSYREARQAMRIARDLYPTGFVVGYSEIGLYRLLFSVPPTDLDSFYRETLGPLEDYDRLHGSDLARTLETYLLNGGNMAHSARDLYVHYNTLRYRLVQIERVVGKWQGEPARRVQLEVSFQARRVVRARGGMPGGGDGPAGHRLPEGWQGTAPTKSDQAVTSDDG